MRAAARRTGLITGLALLCTLLPAAGASPAAGAAHYVFGTLVTQPGHVLDEKNAGAEVVMIEPLWRLYEPQDGVFDNAYAAQIKQQVQAALNAGQKVTIGTAL